MNFLESQKMTEFMGLGDWCASLIYSSSYLDYLGKYFTVGNNLLGKWNWKPFRMVH